MAFQEERGRSPWPRTCTYRWSCYVFLFFHWDSPPGEITWRDYICILRICPERLQHRTFTCYHIHRQTGVKYRKVHPCLSLVSGEIQEQKAPTNRPNLEFFLPDLQGFSSPPGAPRFCCSMNNMNCPDHPCQIPWEDPIAPHGPKAGLICHRYTQESAY